MDIKIDQLVKGTVATPPTIYHKLQQALNDPGTTFEEYAEIIKADPGLATRLLKIANSPFFGFETEIDFISHALSIIGMEQMADLALVSLVIEKFKGIPRDLIDLEAFWQHSIGCGLTARILAKHQGKPANAERYYLAGILHDIGTLVMSMGIPVQSRLLISQSKLDKKPLWQTELDELGFNHADVGSALLQAWNLPDAFVQAIKFSHTPMSAPSSKELAVAVHFADCLAYQLEFGNSGEPTQPELEEDILEFLEMTEASLEEIKKDTLDLFGDTMNMFF